MANNLKPADGEHISNIGDLAKVVVHKGNFHVYFINEDKLKRLKDGYLSTNFAIACALFGALVALVPATHSLAVDDPERPYYWVSALFSLIFFIVFGIKARLDWNKGSEIFEQITKSTETTVQFSLKEEISTDITQPPQS
jgi:hypothetical protein